MRNIGSDNTTRIKILFLPFLTLLLILNNPPVFGQVLSENDNPTLTKTIPPSPNAAALGKYGEYPVNHYTGLPSINIPIYNLKSGDLEVPISLSYHAGGNKVEEIASWVGLGWSLNAGGVITRTVRGIADERDNLSGFGNYRENYNTVVDPNTAVATRDHLLNQVKAGNADLETDIYHFNFGNYSGKFFLDGEISNPSTLIAQTFPKQGLKISFQRTGNEVTRWVITAENGVQFIFGTTTNASRSAIERNNSESFCSDDSGANLTAGGSTDIASSWFLVEVISPNGHRIDLEYEQYNYDYRTFGSETAYYLAPLVETHQICQSRYNQCYVRNRMTGQRLKSIYSSQLQIDFVALSEYRYDLCQDKALGNILIYSDDPTNPIHDFEFDYGYFKRPSDPLATVLSSPCASSDEHPEYRLKLLSLTEFSENGNAKPSHTFTYNESQHLPPRISHNGTTAFPTSYGQDHWGYFNGVINNKRNVTGPSTLIPTFHDTYSHGGSTAMFVQYGANRSTYGNFSKTYVLESIQYPTGGSTSFLFESNKISNAQIPPNYTLSYSDKSTGPHNFSSNADGQSETYANFTVNSDYSNGVTQGAYVTTLFNEHSGGANACSSDPTINPGEWVVNRYIIDYSTGNTVYDNASQDGETFFLPNGTYYIRLERKTGYTCDSEFAMRLTWTETDGGTGNVQDVEVGGLRIKEIRSHDGVNASNDLITTFDYQSFTDETLSSGYMVNFPVYSWKFYNEWHEKFLLSQSITFSCPYFVNQSFSHYPLATTSGGIVGYENVTVRKGSQSLAGKTEYIFTSAQSNPDEFTFLSPPTSFDWQRGRQKSMTSYKEDQGVFKKVLQEDYQYSNLPVTRVPGMKLVEINKSVTASVVTPFLQQSYNTATQQHYNAAKTTRNQYSDDESKWVESDEEFVYSQSHFQLTSKSIENSDGSTTIYRNTYPMDIDNAFGIPQSPSDENGQALRALLDQNILNAPVERITIRKEGALETVIDGRMTIFKKDLNNHVLPNIEYSLDTDSPISGFTGVSYIPGTGLSFDASFSANTNYELFDILGNLNQYTSRDGITTTVIWGYEGQYPVAQIVGATLSQVETAIGNGFDADNVTYNLSGTELNALKTGLPSALITSYQYDPGRGLISETGPNNQTMRYEYDAYGRLFRIRDHLDNVIKQYEYHYANQN